MSTLDEARMFNNAFYEQLNTRGMEKRAEDAVTDFTRTKMRQDGVFRKFMPPVKITNDQLDRQPYTVLPCKTIDMEPGSPAAITVAFGTQPQTVYIRGPRYLVTFSRILSPRFMVDVDELRTWIMDIRQVLSDNSIKDMLLAEDFAAFDAVDEMVGDADTTSVYSGAVQHETIADGITRDGLNDAFKIMPRMASHFQPAMCIANVIFMFDLQKWTREEWGGDPSADVAKKGWTETEFFGRKWLFTIERDLVADNELYMFADQKALGKHLTLEETVMHIKREAFMLDFFSYQTSGATFGHSYGMAKATFSGA